MKNDAYGVKEGDEPQQRERDFEAGWRTAANWMERDDLIADIGSPAYLADRAAALGVRGSVCTRSHPHENMDADCERLTVIARQQNAVARGVMGNARKMDSGRCEAVVAGAWPSYPQVAGSIPATAQHSVAQPLPIRAVQPALSCVYRTGCQDADKCKQAGQCSAPLAAALRATAGVAVKEKGGKG